MAANEDRSDLEILWFRNEYYCDECQLDWVDHWSCGCDDCCPECNIEYEPVRSVEITPKTPKHIKLAMSHARDTREAAVARESRM